MSLPSWFASAELRWFEFEPACYRSSNRPFNFSGFQLLRPWLDRFPSS